MSLPDLPPPRDPLLECRIPMDVCLTPTLSLFQCYSVFTYLPPILFSPLFPRFLPGKQPWIYIKLLFPFSLVLSSNNWCYVTLWRHRESPSPPPVFRTRIEAENLFAANLLLISRGKAPDLVTAIASNLLLDFPPSFSSPQNLYPLNSSRF